MDFKFDWKWFLLEAFALGLLQFFWGSLQGFASQLFVHEWLVPFVFGLVVVAAMNVVIYVLLLLLRRGNLVN